MTGYLVQAFIYLCAAVVAVPIAKRLGLGSVLGYLVAGVVIGPVIGLVGAETETLQHFAEFGVVMMLFLVGLELEPRMLWSMRKRLIGLGGLQVVLTSLLIMAIVLAVGIEWRIALTLGLILSLSSTAIVLQTLKEKGLSKTEGGRGTFSILLLQDIAVIPMLAIIPLLELPALRADAARLSAQISKHTSADTLFSDLPNWAHAFVLLAVIGTVILAGYYLSRPLFRYVANSGLREIFTATALMLVIGIAALMSLVGLSPALGTFLAGVVLANSEFRHELESNIEPFKGLLLGLFFITVGAGIKFTVLSEHLVLVGCATLGIMAVKAAVLYLLAMLFGIRDSGRWLITLGLAQAGEFGFVLLSFSVQNNTLPAPMAEILALVVALSMFLSPALFILFDKVLLPRFERTNLHREADVIDQKGRVVIAGIGRFGQIVNRMLVANGITTTVLDHHASQVDNLRKFNVKSFYGDAARPELLHTAGIDEAELLIIAIDEREQAVELVKHMKQSHKHVAVLARAYDEPHLYQLKQAGADYIIKETYQSALDMGAEALQRLDYHAFHAEQLKTAFYQAEQKTSASLYRKWIETSSEKGLNESYRQLYIQLEQAIRDAMQQERGDSHARGERGWTPPPKQYIADLARDNLKTAEKD